MAAAAATILLAPAAGPAATLFLARYAFDPLEGLPELPAELSLPAPPADAAATFVVQMDGPPAADARERLAERAEILGYLPEDAWLVRATASAIEDLSEDPAVRWTGLWQPAFKLSPRIGRHDFRDPERAVDPRRTLLVWGAGDAEALRATIEALGAEVADAFVRRIGHRLVVRARDEELPALARLDRVLWIEERPEFRTWNNTTTWVTQSNVTNSRPVWDRGITGEGQIAIVMDTGVDYNACWFRDPGETPGPSHRKVIDYDLFGGAAYDGCDNGHGSHVSGTLAGNQTPVTGSSNANGVAPDAKLIVQDIGLDDFLSCLLGLVSVPNDLTSAFQTGWNGGGRVHSNSWGSTSTSYDGFCVDVDEFMWSHPEFLIVFAAGNSGPGSGTVGSPGVAKNCATVGATLQAPNQETIASYSSRGPTFDARTKPTICLPGGDSSLPITSVNNHTGNPPANTCATAGNPFYGTSMATPAVSGAALLARQYFTQGWYPSGAPVPGDAFTPSAALLKAALVNGADDMGAANIPNNTEGWGRVLLDDVLYFDGDARELRVEEHAGVSTGQTVELEWAVEPGEPLEIALVWTDRPATQGAGIALVNDLDLEVEGPDGTWRGNVFSGGQSTTGGAFDRRNVEESVRRNAPLAGTYTVRVTGFNVPLGPQPFALASTGAFAGWPQVGTGVAELAAAPAGGLGLTVAPNPSRGRVSIELTSGAAPRGVTVEVYDVRGARVAAPWRGTIDNVASLVWDGRDAAGRDVPGGVYFVRATSGAETLSEKVLLLR
jgi:hypothetical protein